MIMNSNKNVPQKGAARKWSKRLKELGQTPPPADLVKKINKDDKKKVASPSRTPKDMEME
jgi:hypothetical protein